MIREESMTRYLTSLALLSILVLAGCRAAPIYNASDVAFTIPPTSSQKELTLDDYKDAIIRGGARRGWTFEDAGPGHLIGNVAVRNKHFATVDIVFDTKEYSIVYKSSQNLNYNAGRGEIHPNYNSWIRNLEQEIQTEIVTMKAS